MAALFQSARIGLRPARCFKIKLELYNFIEPLVHEYWTLQFAYLNTKIEKSTSCFKSIPKFSTHHIEEHGWSVKVWILLSILYFDGRKDNSTTLYFNAGRVNSCQLELLHVTYTPR